MTGAIPIKFRIHELPRINQAKKKAPLRRGEAKLLEQLFFEIEEK